ncbi:hypothetical protein [Streptomyces sp. SM12]|uniref:hypothetical protein n=1 Tax=Streptomyces sp. SM12 TaxID=1071602 RepID=UPI0011B0E546|nr:hypothetical protein [Streptomyces sp. SM12]
MEITPGTPDDWAITGGTVAMETWPGASGVISPALTIRSDGLGTITAVHSERLDVVPGASVRVTSVLAAPNYDPSAAYITMSPRIRWYGSADEYLTTEPLTRPHTTTGAITLWIHAELTRVYTVPPGAVYARVELEIVHDEESPDRYAVDSIAVDVAPQQYSLTKNDAAGMVTLSITHSPDDIWADARINVWRISASGDEHPVRGYGGDLLNAPNTPPPLVLEDYEAPMGERVWYRIRWEWGGWHEELLTRTIDSPTLPNPDLVWLKAPSLPALNTTVEMAEPISWDRQARATAYHVVGRRNPVVVYARRAGRTGQLIAHVWDFRTNEALDALLDTGSPILIQAMPGHGVVGNLYLHVDGVAAEVISGSASEPGWRWTLDVTEIDRPAGGIQGSAGRTWADVDEYADWAEVYDSYATWADVLTGGD